MHLPSCHMLAKRNSYLRINVLSCLFGEFPLIILLKYWTCSCLFAAWMFIPANWLDPSWTRKYQRKWIHLRYYSHCAGVCFNVIIQYYYMFLAQIILMTQRIELIITLLYRILSASQTPAYRSSSDLKHAQSRCWFQIIIQFCPSKYQILKN